MKKITSFLILLMLLACTSQVQHAGTSVQDTAKEGALTGSSDTVKTHAEDILMEEDASDAFLDCFIVIADTGMNYFALRDAMLQLHARLKVAIDTMHRTVYRLEDGIVMADSSEHPEDNAYYPRRHPGESMSLEYLQFYAKDSDPKTIALVTGIYGNRQEAVAALAALKARTPGAFLIKARYISGA